MNSKFLKHLCNIKSITIENTWGIEKKVETFIYTNLPCYLYSTSWGYVETGSAVRTQINTTKLKVNSENTNIKEGMYIEVIDPKVGTLWNYVVSLFPRYNWFLSNSGLDAITLTLKAI